MLNSAEQKFSLQINMKSQLLLAFSYLLAEKISFSAVFSKKEFATVSNLRFNSMKNLMLRWVVHEKRFITSRPVCASMQSDQGLHYLLTESLDTTECMNGEQIPSWYFQHEQDDLTGHFAHVQRHIFAWHSHINPLYTEKTFPHYIGRVQFQF